MYYTSSNTRKHDYNYLCPVTFPVHYVDTSLLTFGTQEVLTVLRLCKLYVRQICGFCDLVVQGKGQD